ncbi:POTRA domain-containing protein [Bdellovibrio sp. HCB185ZH]|uniref:POTRA domain-containing protein n=1 Tax=Bdellovibrio sp. HCB185ZH TaxID=3394235 RepID=UPI0039A45D65
MIRTLVMALTFLLFIQSSPAWAKKALDISALPADIQTDLLRRYPQINKDYIALDVVDDILRYLQPKPQFDRLVVTEGAAGSYKLDYIHAKRIGEVNFSGNNFLSNSETSAIFAVKSGDVFDQQSLAELGEKLRLHYRDLGFLNTVVDIEMPPGKNETVDINLKVTENKRTLINNLIVQSPNGKLNKDLVNKLDSRLDDPLTDKTLSDITKAARAFLNKERYVRADFVGPKVTYNADESEATLNYRVDRPEAYEFDFKGQRIFSTRKLRNALDLDNYYSANPNIGTELAAKLRNHYLSEGYARAEVTATEDDNGNQFLRKITFDVEEGPRVKIQAININGKFSRPPKHYSDIIRNYSSVTVADGYYNKDDFDTGLKNLVLALQNEGYLQSKIVSTRLTYNKEKDQVSLYVNLDEGPLTLIQSVSFLGNQAYKNDELLKVTGLQPGPLKLSQIEEAVKNIKTFYQKNGYIEMLLLNEKEDLVTYDETNTKAILNFKIFEGPQVRAASIILEGNTFTRDYVLYQELEVKKGELITPQKIEDSISHLQRTGFFGTVEVKTLEEKTNIADRTVIVRVTEREPGTFNIGAGATNERQLTLRGYTGISYRNLLGTGRGVSLRLEGNYNIADVKYLEHKVVAGYLEPYLFGSHVRGRVNITLSSQITDFNVKQVTDLNQYTYTIEKDLTSKILGTWDIYSLAQVRDSGLDASYPYAPTQQDIVTTGPNIDFDFRDNPFNPTAGTFTRVNAEYSDPVFGGTETIKYWRAVAGITFYSKLGTAQKQPVVWANNFRGGYIKNLSHLPDTADRQNGIPWDKKGFTLGGISTVRGYEAGTEYFPNNNDLGIAGGNKKYYLTTDSTMGLIKSELRFPIYGSIGGALFYDGGIVQIQGLEINEPYRAATGAGFRYNTPVGPLSVDLAWKLNMQPGESPWRVHISIGTF